MSSDWPLVKLGDLTINLDTKRRPVKEADRKSGPYPYYGASGIVDYVDGYIFDGEHLLIAEDGENLRTRQTPIAFRACGKFWVNNHAHIVLGNERASTRYLEYAVLGSDITSYLTGAVMPKLTQGNLNRIEVPCPPREVQDAIVGVLGSLDDRITLLRETNATLEAIAQALFKSWFVDFDPVRAKMAGRTPEGMDEATVTLFPDALEETELGLVPAGWKVGSILGIAKLLSGGTPKTDRPEYWGGNIPWASAKDVSQASDPVLLTTERTITELGLNGSSTKLVPAYATAVVARGATTGRLVMFGKELAMNQTCYALVSRQNTPTVLSLQLRREIGRLVSAAHGSVFDTITTITFEKSVCLLPPEALCTQLEQITRPIFDKIIANVAKAQSLSQLRDALLPRLISGQLRLPEAQAHLEDTLA